MRPVVALAVAEVLALVVAAVPAASPQQPHNWELRLLREEKRDRIWPGQDEATAFPNLKRKLKRPLLVLRPADVESYVWSVQRITLRPAATQRLLAAHPDDDLALWYIPHYPYAVLVDGEFLYGGVFDDPMSQMTMDFPVIHAEVVDGRAVLHLLPVQQSWAFDARFEETVGGGGGLRAVFFAETEPIGATIDETESDPLRDRFRAVLRDPRIRAVFEPLGTLVEAPPPPPDEEVLAAADRAVDAARAAVQPARIARQLADDYHLFFPLGYRAGLRSRIPMDKVEAIELFSKGWKPGRYAVLVTEGKVRGDEGIVYTLFYLRGKVEGRDKSAAILARRRYRRTGTGWKLVLEVHHTCFDDGPGPWRSVEEDFQVILDGPCWPPPEDEEEPPLPAD